MAGAPVGAATPPRYGRQASRAGDNGEGGGRYALSRLLQLVSPSLPVGGFTYSQGLEWAVETGWVTCEQDLEAWLGGLLHDTLAHVDLPLLLRLHCAAVAGDEEAIARWSNTVLACRETTELRAEERARGRAMAALLVELGVPDAMTWRDTLAGCQLAGFALAATRWRIPPEETLSGYAWSWLENLVIAGVKLVPLGQSAGQRVLFRLGAEIAGAVEVGTSLADKAIGASAPAAAIASARHETQYTRLFRS